METGLLQLRSAPGDVELLNSIFRSAHTIKGGAGSFAMTSLVRFTHSLENLLDRLRSSQMQATGEVIDLLLRSVDVLRELVAADADAAMPAAAMELEKRIEAVQPAEPAQEEHSPRKRRSPSRTIGRSGSIASNFAPTGSFSIAVQTLSCSCGISPHWAP